MKKLFSTLLLLAILTACEQAKYGTGGRNACQFVKEQMPELREDIASVEVTKEDTLLSDIIFIYDQVAIAKAGSDFWSGEISKKKYQETIDKYVTILSDIDHSWKYGIVVNDSLKKLKTYDDAWRKVYTVLVTMKSGTTKEHRVLMDTDGLTPRMTETEFYGKLFEYQETLIEAQKDIYRKY